MTVADSSEPSFRHRVPCVSLVDVVANRSAHSRWEVRPIAAPAPLAYRSECRGRPATASAPLYRRLLC